MVTKRHEQISKINAQPFRIISILLKNRIMISRNIFSVVLVLLLVACNNSDDNDGINPESVVYEFQNDSQIILGISQTGNVFEIEPGTNTVFRYTFNSEDVINIADDEYTEIIHFEVDGSLDSFSYSNSALQAQNLFIRRLCFCTSNDFVFADIGSVSGTKLANGNWDISISMTFDWDEFSETETRTISGTFAPGAF